MIVSRKSGDLLLPLFNYLAVENNMELKDSDFQFGDQEQTLEK